jgi:hypothetical protein
VPTDPVNFPPLARHGRNELNGKGTKSWLENGKREVYTGDFQQTKVPHPPPPPRPHSTLRWFFFFFFFFPRLTHHRRRITHQAHGFGRREYGNGATYVGSYEKDRRVGRGVFTWPCGHQFAGEWKVTALSPLPRARGGGSWRWRRVVVWRALNGAGVMSLPTGGAEERAPHLPGWPGVRAGLDGYARTCSPRRAALLPAAAAAQSFPRLRLLPAEEKMQVDALHAPNETEVTAPELKIGDGLKWLHK